MSKEKFVRDKPHINIGTVILLVFGISSGISLGMTIYFDIMETRDNDGDSIPDLEEVSHPLFFDAADDILTFRSYETSGHELGHNLGTSHDGAVSNLNIQLDLFNDVSTGIAMLDFNIKYDSLIEFVDGNNNGFFDLATDTIIGKTDLTNMLRIGFGFGVDGQPVYYSNYSTLDGVFHVNFYTAREHVLLGRQVGTLAPYELKSIITFINYIPTTGGTNLALNLSLSSNEVISFSGTTLTATSSVGAYEVIYEWLNFAISDGVEMTVNSTVPTISSNNGNIIMNFGQFTHLSYDPILHWSYPRSSVFKISDIPWNYITIGSLTIVTLGTVAKISRGKKKKKEEPKPPPSKFDSIATEMTPSGDKPSEIPVSKKKPGRLKYVNEPPKKSSKTDPEKSIPNTLRHKNR